MKKPSLAETHPEIAAQVHGCPGCYNMTFDEMTQRPLKFRDEQRKYT